MKENLAYTILDKIYTIAAVILGFIILVKRTDLIAFNIPFIDTLEIIVLIASLYAIFDIFHVMGDSEIEVKWKIYGVLSNIFALFVVLVIGAELLGILILQNITSINLFYPVIGILLIIDNVVWFLVGD